MNSMSRPRENDDSACGCRREKEKEAAVLLKCKTGRNVTVPVTSDNYPGTTVSTLTVNTKKFKDPCFKFDFTANVSTLVLTDLTIQMFKKCKGDDEAVEFGPAWNVLTAIDFHQIISFFVCDCDCDCDCDKDDCCTYTVVVNADTPAIFNNPTLSVLVVEKTRC